jgi:hypothetical protein
MPSTTFEHKFNLKDKVIYSYWSGIRQITGVRCGTNYPTLYEIGGRWVGEEELKLAISSSQSCRAGVPQ